ncbi:MAG TPA: FtsW/RodA/SpoVE family cell cycle protein, partial [Streptosporangiaceae bacterium]|nr:FtsW/RodA/SpoVE family cell cycle protein [Streptosporangiaceae bacterium]
MSFGRGRGAGLRGLEPVRPALGFRGVKTAVPALRRASLWRRAVARDSMLRHVDWMLILAVLALSLIGTLLVWSATAPGLAQAGANPHAYLEKQLLVVVIGLIMLTGVTLIDYRILRMIAPFAYAAGCLGLLAVLSPLGTTILGSHSWIPLPGGFQVEPSEYAKIGLIMMIALTFGAAGERSAQPGLRPLALAVACTVPVIGLVLAEPDLGVVVVLVVISGGMIALSGVRLRWLALLTAAAALAITAVLKLHLLKAYQVGRLTSFLHPSADLTGNGWQAFQAKIAIGSGGMFGQGLFHGQLTAGSFLGSYSFQGTDFIFAVAGEELGFAGCAAIVVLLGLVIFRAVRIAARADDAFGLLVAAGIAIWFAVQAFINIGMTIGIAPVTGLPLPFVSYGGSALFADMIAVGVLQSIHR